MLFRNDTNAFKTKIGCSEGKKLNENIDGEIEYIKHDWKIKHDFPKNLCN